MSGLVEAIQEERAVHVAALESAQRKIAALDEMEALARVLDGEPDPPPAPEPPKPKRKQQQDHSARQTMSAERLAERVEDAKRYLARVGEAKPGDVREALDLPRHGGERAKRIMRAVAADPDVVTTGATNSRKYSLRDGAPLLQRRRVASGGAMPPDPGPKTAPRQQPGVDGKVMAALCIPRTIEEVAFNLEMPGHEVQAIVDRLVADDDVRAEAGGRFVARS